LAFFSQAYGQSFPIPPPFPSSPEQEDRIAEGDKSPPNVEILTDKLDSGKNVFRVKISDESSLRTREVRYVQDGQFKTEGLFRDQNDVYKALIDIQPPSRIVAVTVADAAGNVAHTFREYDVLDRQDIFKDIMDILGEIPEFVRSLLERF
jgi:hypothetical protein